MEIPPTLRSRVLDIHGARGALWLDELPRRVGDCARRWSLDLGPPLSGASYNYLVSARRADGTAAVLKLSVPGWDASRELEALRHFDGRGAARLLDAEPDQGAMLLERVEPGTPLAELCAVHDERATAAAAGVMRRLRRPPPAEHALPSLERWTEGLDRARAAGPGLFRAAVDEALALRADLLASAEAPVLLHADLHHDNLLAAEREPWLAIDPHGVVGSRRSRPARCCAIRSRSSSRPAT